MFYLFFQTWIWILAAGLLGLFVGWLIWGRRDSAVATAPDSAEVSRLEQELSECRSRCRALESTMSDANGANSAQETPSPEIKSVESMDVVSGEDIVVSDDWRPEGLSEPRSSGADDLKRIRGIGPVIERTLNELGIYHFDQLAAFDDGNIRWVDNYIAFPGRILREEWVSQAAELADGGTTEFSNRYDRSDKQKT